MDEMLDGLISFYASHHAIRADKKLREAGMEAELIPGPKELSPNCGVALRIVYAEREEARAVLTANKVEIDEILEYRPRSDAWDKRGRASLRRRRS